MSKSHNIHLPDRSKIYIPILGLLLTAFASCITLIIRTSNSIEKIYIGQISRLESSFSKISIEQIKLDELVSLEVDQERNQTQPQEILRISQVHSSHEEVLAGEQRILETIANLKELIGTFKGIDTEMYPHLKNHIKIEMSLLNKKIEFYSQFQNYLVARLNNKSKNEIDNDWVKVVLMMPEIVGAYNESISESRSSIDSIKIDQNNLKIDLHATLQIARVYKNSIKIYTILSILLFLFIISIIYELFKQNRNK